MHPVTIFSLALFCVFRAAAQTPVIWLPARPAPAEVRAAEVLHHYLKKITVQRAAVIETASTVAGKWVPGQPLIVIGQHHALASLGLEKTPALPDDAYFLQGKNNVFHIAGGGDMGAEYGVYDLLERLGCRKYSPSDSLLPLLNQLELPTLPPTVQKPAFPYRELHYQPAFDEAWARWHRLKTRRDKEQEWGLFVHTFHILCPAEKYFAEHPEYFAWNGAQRSSGQLCLSNDTVRQIVVATLREKMRAKPGAKYWSVSQDDNYDSCKCPRCAASDARYGSPAGTLLAFVNAVAAEFPDKTISTLAYQYTRRAPKGIRPAPNVSICLCSIECDRGQPITEGCRDFARDVEEWASLTDNLMIWDYVVQFRNYVSPFPNWHTLQPNIRLFKKNGARMLFEQGSGGDRSEFSDMRAYLLAKLIWNPEADMDSILTDFGKGYYGSAQPAVWRYIHELTTNLQATGNHLWIYDVPQNERFLNDSLLRQHYLSLRHAETLLNGDTARQRHLLAAWLPIRFALAERAKVDSLSLAEILADPPDQYLRGLQLFVDGCKAAGFNNLHENRYSPEAYMADFTAFLEKQRTAAQGRGHAPRLAKPASATYAKGDPNELTNRRVGELDYRYNWLGFQGNDLVATVRVQGDSCSGISASFLQDQQSWVFFPKEVMFEVSTDGVHFRQVHTEKSEIVPDGKKAVKTVEVVLSAVQRVKFVRVTAVNMGTCPAWHSCNGNPCWIFSDEVVVR
ncbi:MAG: DUF4838 domain-containing protein [Saprospiraceae bacterium]